MTTPPATDRFSDHHPHPNEHPTLFAMCAVLADGGLR